MEVKFYMSYTSCYWVRQNNRGKDYGDIVIGDVKANRSKVKQAPS